jgi:phosphate uptake regulator
MENVAKYHSAILDNRMDELSQWEINCENQINKEYTNIVQQILRLLSKHSHIKKQNNEFVKY